MRRNTPSFLVWAILRVRALQKKKKSKDSVKPDRCDTPYEHRAEKKVNSEFHLLPPGDTSAVWMARYKPDRHMFVNQD